MKLRLANKIYKYPTYIERFYKKSTLFNAHTRLCKVIRNNNRYLRTLRKESLV